MATLSSLAESHARYRDALAAEAAREARRAWSRVDKDDVSGSWLSLIGRVLSIVTGFQVLASSRADTYTSEALELQGGDVESAGEVNPQAFAGVASDGRSLFGLLYRPVAAFKIAMSRGNSLQRSLAVGQATLDMAVRTQILDAGRVADGVAVAARPRVGYVRALRGRGCSRCAVLAGRYYRYNSGFRRHPRCKCIHVPAKGEKAARREGLITDPREFFDSLTPEEQDEIFTKAGAQAIRDGADISQVVNARRGAAGLSRAGARLTLEEQRIIRGGRDRGRLTRTSVYGRDVFITDEGTTRRGFAGSRLGALDPDAIRVPGERYRRSRTPRLMPESIYELARDRDDAIRLLRRFGYII